MDNPIRILHVVSIMNVGGLETLIMNIYRNIDKEKIQFDFLVNRCEKGIYDEEIKSLGGRIFNIPHIQEIGIRKHKNHINEFLSKHGREYKIIHSHVNTLSGIYLKEAKKNDINCRIAHSHSTNSYDNKNIIGLLKSMYRKYTRLSTKRYATEHFACSDVAGKWLFGNKIANKSLITIKNGIDTNKYIYNEEISKKVRSELNISKETLLIGHVGRFDIPKNHDFLIDIADKLKLEALDFKLCLVGEGHLKVDIEEKIKKLNLQDNIIFLGLRNDVNELMMAFDIFTFPSLFEGLGIVLIEAQATGLNCLVSDTIPNEADMNIDLFNKLHLDNIDEWVESIKNIYLNKEEIRKNRYSNNSKIKENGYDILSTVRYLQDFYIERHREIL